MTCKVSLAKSMASSHHTFVRTIPFRSEVLLIRHHGGDYWLKRESACVQVTLVNSWSVLVTNCLVTMFTEWKLYEVPGVSYNVLVQPEVSLDLSLLGFFWGGGDCDVASQLSLHFTSSVSIAPFNSELPFIPAIFFFFILYPQRPVFTQPCLPPCAPPLCISCNVNISQKHDKVSAHVPPASCSVLTAICYCLPVISPVFASFALSLLGFFVSPQRVRERGGEKQAKVN